MVLVKRKHLASVGLTTVLKKISLVGMKKIPHELALIRFAKKFQLDHEEMKVIYDKYMALGDDGKLEVETFLEESVEIIGLPASIVEDLNLELAELTREDVYYLEPILEK